MAWLSGWSKRIKLTIDKDQVDTANQLNFPVMVYLSAASGIGDVDVSCVFDELVSDANRKKIAITSSDGTTELYVEIERWDDANEKAWLHVKVPSVAYDVDTILYLYYDAAHADNTTYVGDTTDAVTHSVWDTNFVGVWHMAQDPNGDVADAIKDSTSGTHDATPAGSMTTADLVDAKVGKGIDFEGTDDCLAVADSADWDLSTGDFTFESIFYTTSAFDPSNDVRRIFSRSDLTSTNGAWSWGIGTNPGWSLGHRINIVMRSGGAIYDAESDEVTLNTGTYYYIVVRRISGTISFLLNAVAQGSVGSMGYDLDGDQALYTACRWDDGIAEALTGVLDEDRISNTGRSDPWIKATYNSLFDSLITFGGEEVNPLVVTSEPIESTSVIFATLAIILPCPAIESSSVIDITGIFKGRIIPCPAIASSSTLDAGIVVKLATPSIESVSSIVAPLALNIPVPPITSTGTLSIVRVWDGAAWKAWVDAYGNLAVKYYYLTLTGDNETPPVDDITIPMSSFQARRKSGDPTFLAAVIPGTDYEAAINARSNGEMVIEMAYELNGVIEYQEEIIRAQLDDDGIRKDEGGRNQSISLTGHKTESFVGKVSWLRDVTYKRDNGGDLAFRCASCDLYLNPGDTARYGSDSFTVGQIVLSISPELQIMEVEESAT